MTRAIPWAIIAAALVVVAWRRARPGRGRTSRIRLPLPRPELARGDVAVIAAREIRQRVRSRLFRVVTILMLFGVTAAIVIPVLTKTGAPTLRVGVVGDLSAADGAAVVAAGASASAHVRVVPEPDVGAARRDLLASRVSVVVTTAARAVVTMKAVTPTDTSTTARLARAIAASLGEQQAFNLAGLSAEQAARVRAARPLPLQSVKPATRRETERSAAILGVVLLFVLLTQYNTWTLIGVMEEKSSRVVEVLLATVRPGQLLTGKVLGIGLLVLAQAGLLVGCALAVAAAVGSNLLHGAGPALVISTLVWLILGYAFYSWVYAAAGSLAERQDQVQSLALPIAAPMIVAYVMALTVAASGTPSPLFYVLAYLPPTAPFTMPVLVALGDVTWWQQALAALLSVVSTVGVARAAATIYRRAVLRTGRRVRLRDVVVDRTR